MKAAQPDELADDLDLGAGGVPVADLISHTLDTTQSHGEAGDQGWELRAQTS
jgi:hypothetical protein